jgi:cytochrome c1
MRFTVVHDRQGTIQALVVSAPDAPPAQLVTQPGQRMAEIDAPEVTIDLNGPRLNEDLSDLMETHQVEFQTEQSRLTRKPD